MVGDPKNEEKGTQKKHGVFFSPYTPLQKCVKTRRFGLQALFRPRKWQLSLGFQKDTVKPWWATGGNQKNQRTLNTPRSQQTPWNSGSALGTLDGDTWMLEDPQGILQAGTNLQKSWSTERVDKSGGLGEAIWIFRSQLSTIMRATALGPMDKTLEDLKLNHKTPTILPSFFLLTSLKLT